MSLLHPLIVPLSERTAVLVVVAFFLTRLKAFRSILYRRASWKEKGVMIAVFSAISILGTYLGIAYMDAIANSRVIGTVVAGLLAGPWVGFCTGLIAGIHRYTLGGFTDLACAMSTVLEGFLAGLVYRWMKHRQITWVTGFLVGFVAEWMQMGIILVVAQPYEQAWELVQAISIPMVLVNSLGISVFMIIIDLVKKEEERIGALQAQRTLQVADRALSYLRDGLTRSSAELLAHEILRTTRVAAVGITDTRQVLAHVGLGSTHHQAGMPIITDATKEVIATKELKIARTKEEIGCSKKDCSLRSAIIVPLMKKEEVVGALKLYQDRSHRLSAVDLELVRGMGRFISTQLEIAELEKQSRLLADAEIRALHAQINPHFLFNAINTIVSFIRFRPEKARELLLHLSEYFRRNLHHSGGYVTLEEELEHVEAYLAIERARFGDKLRVEYEIDPDTRPCIIPALIIQPLVENAIKHGLLPKREGGTVRIRAGFQGDALCLSVADDGVGMVKEAVGLAEKKREEKKRRYSGIGLSNVKNRIESLYGLPYTVTIESAAGQGTVCTITLPSGVNRLDQSVYRR